MRLEGKRALVTGAQQGIGRAAVLALAREGADVAINWFEGQPAAKQLAEEVRALGRRALTVQGDVSKSADVTRVVEETHRGLGGVDILINNAGVFPRSPFLELTEAEWDHVLDVNLKGSFLVAQAVARKMVADGTKGAIVNISSSSVRGHVLGGPLLGQQERHHRYHALDGAGARPAWHPRKCDRARHHGYGAAPLSVFRSRNGRAIPPRAPRQHGQPCRHC